MTYKPTEIDIIWATSMTRLLSDNGILAFPDARLIFKVSHMQHKLTLLNPEELEDPHSAEVYKRTVAVFAALGYKVVGGSP